MSDKNPLISIVIPAYNEEKYIENVLKSIKKQTYKNYEVIVVDNNSTDNTAQIAKKYGAKVVKEKKKGSAAARQAGFSEAKGEIIASTDSDAIVPENWLEKFIKEFEKDPSLVAVGGVYRIYSGPFFARLAMQYGMYPVYAFGKLFSGWVLIGPNFAVKREAFNKTSGFSTNIPQGEDIDIALKLQKIGKVLLKPDYVYSSGRRFEKGLIKGLQTYGFYWPLKVIFKKDSYYEFKDFR